MRKKRFLLITIALLMLLSLCFYWFQWRPSHIRKGCSWVKTPKYAIITDPEKVEKYKEEIRKLDRHSGWVESRDYYEEFTGEYYYKKASSQEYTACIHEKGI